MHRPPPPGTGSRHPARTTPSPAAVAAGGAWRYTLPAMSSAPRPVLLCILDGWGLAPGGPDNAIAAARAPVWRRLARGPAATRLRSCGEAVGLPCGQMGNSEVGHLTIGAGRIVAQELPRIDRAVAEGSLAAHPRLAAFAAALSASGGRCHLMGLLSPGGVHSHQRHMAALACALGAAGIEVLVHAFLDGRDTPPASAGGHLARFAAQAPQAAMATVAGRYFAMDRDRRWPRIRRAWRAIVQGQGESAPDAAAALDRAARAGHSDEFVPPTAIAGYGGVRPGDGLLMANFRADRVRQLLAALLDPAFTAFSRPPPAFAAALGMTAYGAELAPLLPALFETDHVEGSLGALAADAGLRQLRIAETEKFAHVTYFFNGGRERVFAGEERILVPSPQVATYDLKPEMAAAEVTDRLVAALRQQRFDLAICNFANPDMVGHTGIFPAAVRAVEAVDLCLGRLAGAVAQAGGRMLITADHGNVETMRDPRTGQAHTAHTTNPVPLVLTGADAGWSLRPGGLADIAPTLLQLLGLPQPARMSGRSLLLPPPG